MKEKLKKVCKKVKDFLFYDGDNIDDLEYVNLRDIVTILDGLQKQTKTKPPRCTCFLINIPDQVYSEIRPKIGKDS